MSKDKKKKREHIKFLILTAITMLSMTIYIVWRALFTIPGVKEYGWIPFLLGLALLIAEAASAIEAFVHCVDLTTKNEPEMPDVPHELFPHVDILIAKINGIFKRKYGQEEIVEGNIRLNTVKQWLYVDGQKKEVTEKEFELLKLLIENKNVTLKKEYLFNTVWGSDSESELQTLTVHIKWLREKIEENPKKPKHIITEWGVGYRFE